jgi:hypothetical protein
MVESDLLLMALLMFLAVCFLAVVCYNHEERIRMGPVLIGWDLTFLSLSVCVLMIFFIIRVMYINC